MEIAWNSHGLEVAYMVLGWVAFVLWSCSFYPQFLLNFSRKSVVGLNFNYLLMNNTKHTLYLIYNASLYFSPLVQFQYHQKYGFHQMIPVAANDVAFSTHSVLISAAILFQVAIYERGNQTFSRTTIGFVTLVWITVAVCFFIALPSQSWLWLISIFNTMQVIMTTIKYIPQVRIPFFYKSLCCKIQAVMNCMRRRTDGFSIGMVFFDFSGGLSNYAQMVIQSIDQNSWVNFSGNIGKVLLSLVSMFFDIVFMSQHFLLYHSKMAASTPSSKLNNTVTEPLIMSPDQPEVANVPVVERV
uniref:Cystinosin homolog n=1 Tax=Cajanus cajan TaxID=3821 RepID=A0A151RN64_CAJCA|nr:Cystinosin isogeny [Cajanus cajan]